MNKLTEQDLIVLGDSSNTKAFLSKPVQLSKNEVLIPKFFSEIIDMPANSKVICQYLEELQFKVSGHCCTSRVYQL